MQQGIYRYTSTPQAVQSRAKFREPRAGNETQKGYGNMMFDVRIVRGNTYAPQVIPLNLRQDAANIQKGSSTRKRRTQKRDTIEAYLAEASPYDPVQGRAHIEVQTEQYLEELSDKVPEFDVQTQTDLFLDQPTLPVFIPLKTGIDVATEINDDLFDFDYEVEPILEILIGKTFEQSLLEVYEEEEIKNIRQHRDEMMQIRNAEIAAVQQAEAAEMRRWEEKERRVAQERARLEREKTVADKVAAAAFAHDYLKTLKASVNEALTQSGFYVDPRAVEVETRFVPWLNERVADNLQKKRASRYLVDDVIRDAHSRGQARHVSLVAAITHNIQIGDDEEQYEKEQDTRTQTLKEMDEEEKHVRAAMAREERERLFAEERERRKLEKEKYFEVKKQREEEKRRKREEEEAAEAAEEAEEEDKDKDEEEAEEGED